MQGFLKLGESDERRCDSAESLRTRMCESVIDPKAEVFTRKNNDLNSDLTNVVQFRPQALKVQLRIGEKDVLLFM